MSIGRLHVLTDYRFQQRLGHDALARLAIEGGADTIQFRQKHGGIRHKLYSARRTAAVCAEAGVPLIVDDHLDLMLAVGASGVHLGQTDLPVAVARCILGADVLIGATANTTAQAMAAAEAGADYIGFGPVFPTTSKSNPSSIRGLAGLEDVCRAVAVPVIAIAGIAVDRVAPVMAAGAHGVAVMTAITCARDPVAATQAFRRAIDAAVARAGQ